jgi:hypothetical protein
MGKNVDLADVWTAESAQPTTSRRNPALNARRRCAGCKLYKLVSKTTFFSLTY